MHTAFAKKYRRALQVQWHLTVLVHFKTQVRTTNKHLQASRLPLNVPPTLPLCKACLQQIRHFVGTSRIRSLETFLIFFWDLTDFYLPRYSVDSPVIKCSALRKKVFLHLRSLTNNSLLVTNIHSQQDFNFQQQKQGSFILRSVTNTALLVLPNSITMIMGSRRNSGFG